MFDIGWTEMMVVAIVAILFVGPKELPGMLRTFGRAIKKLRGMAGEFQQQFDSALKEAELDGVKDAINDVRKLNPASQIKDHLNPIKDSFSDVKRTVEGVADRDTDALFKEDKAAAEIEPANEEIEAPAVQQSPVKPAAAKKPAAKRASGAAKTKSAATKAKAGTKPAAGKAKPAAKRAVVNAKSADAKPGSTARAGGAKAKSAGTKAGASAKPAAAKSKSKSGGTGIGVARKKAAVAKADRAVKNAQASKRAASGKAEA